MERNGNVLNAGMSSDVQRAASSSSSGARNIPIVFQCMYCPLMFPLKSSVEAHQLHHFMDDLMCRKCGDVYASFKDLNIHLSIGPKPYIISCSECSKMYTRKFPKEFYDLSIECYVCTVRVEDVSDIMRHYKYLINIAPKFYDDYVEVHKYVWNKLYSGNNDVSKLYISLEQPRRMDRDDSKSSLNFRKEKTVGDPLLNCFPLYISPEELKLQIRKLANSSSFSESTNPSRNPSSTNPSSSNPSSTNPIRSSRKGRTSKYDEKISQLRKSSARTRRQDSSPQFCVRRPTHYYAVCYTPISMNENPNATASYSRNAEERRDPSNISQQNTPNKREDDFPLEVYNVMTGNEYEYKDYVDAKIKSDGNSNLKPNNVDNDKALSEAVAVKDHRYVSPKIGKSPTEAIVPSHLSSDMPSGSLPRTNLTHPNSNKSEVTRTSKFWSLWKWSSFAKRNPQFANPGNVAQASGGTSRTQMPSASSNVVSSDVKDGSNSYRTPTEKTVPTKAEVTCNDIPDDSYSSITPRKSHTIPKTSLKKTSPLTVTCETPTKDHGTPNKDSSEERTRSIHSVVPRLKFSTNENDTETSPEIQAKNETNQNDLHINPKKSPDSPSEKIPTQTELLNDNPVFAQAITRSEKDMNLILSTLPTLKISPRMRETLEIENIWFPPVLSIFCKNFKSEN